MPRYVLTIMMWSALLGAIYLTGVVAFADTPFISSERHRAWLACEKAWLAFVLWHARRGYVQPPLSIL